MGFLYVDGHVRAYHGERPISSNAYAARRHLAMPATTDYWINDSSGDPLLVITGEVDVALTKAMPRLLRDVRGVVGERRVVRRMEMSTTGKSCWLVLSSNATAWSPRGSVSETRALFCILRKPLLLRSRLRANSRPTEPCHRSIWRACPPGASGKLH
jgi:hypothetical protein